MKMKKVMAAMLAGMMLVSMAGCGTGAQGGSDGAGTDSAQTQESTDGKSTLTIWASGSDNVRQVFETLIDDFNNNSEYAEWYRSTVHDRYAGSRLQSKTDGYRL